MDITAHAVKFIGRAALPVNELIPVQAARKAVDCQIAAHAVQRSREATVFRERQHHTAADRVTADVLRQDRGRQVQRAARGVKVDRFKRAVQRERAGRRVGRKLTDCSIRHRQITARAVEVQVLIAASHQGHAAGDAVQFQLTERQCRE